MISVKFNEVYQNSILVCQINFLNDIENSLPDYYTVHIECLLITPLFKIPILTSDPLVNDKFNISYYKCLIPSNSLPSFKYKTYEIQYKLIFNLFKNTSKTRYEYLFEVYPSSFCDYKYDLFIDRDMLRLDESLEDNETSISELINHIRKSDRSIIKSDNKLKFDESIFTNIVISNYKGDIYFYLKKDKKLINKKIDCEIKQEGYPFLLIKYTKYIKNKMNIEIEYFKNISSTRIFLIINCNGDIEEEELVNINSKDSLYQNIEIRNKKEIFNLKTKYFSVEMYFKICADEFNFLIKPIFVHRKEKLAD